MFVEGVQNLFFGLVVGKFPQGGGNNALFFHLGPQIGNGDDRTPAKDNGPANRVFQFPQVPGPILPAEFLHQAGAESEAFLVGAFDIAEEWRWKPYGREPMTSSPNPV